MLTREVPMKLLIAVPVAAGTLAWSNGPAGNATTNLASECSDPPYATDVGVVRD